MFGRESPEGAVKGAGIRDLGKQGTGADQQKTDNQAGGEWPDHSEIVPPRVPEVKREVPVNPFTDDADSITVREAFMTAHAPSVDALIELIEREIILLQGMAAAERRLQRAIMTRDWAAVEEAIHGMQVVSEEIGQVEARRHAVYQSIRVKLGSSDGDSFYRLLATVDSDTRLKLSNLYRELKVAVLAVRSFNDGIDAYVRGAIGTLNRVLEELHPDRRGRIYARDGATEGRGTTALVVDRVS